MTAHEVFVETSEPSEILRWVEENLPAIAPNAIAAWELSEDTYLMRFYIADEQSAMLMQTMWGSARS